ADAAGCELHAPVAVAPEPYGLGGFPFALADEKMLRLGRLPPVDAAHRIRRAIAAELPEILADPGLPAAMRAKADRCGKPVRRHHERWQARAQGVRFMLER